MTIIDFLFDINHIANINELYEDNEELIRSFSTTEPCVNILKLFINNELIQTRAFVDIYSYTLYEIDQNLINKYFDEYEIQYCYLSALNQYYHFFWYNYDPYIGNDDYRKKLYVKHGVVDIGEFQDKVVFNLMGLYMKGLKLYESQIMNTNVFEDKDQLYKKIKSYSYLTLY